MPFNRMVYTRKHEGSSFPNDSFEFRNRLKHLEFGMIKSNFIFSHLIAGNYHLESNDQPFINQFYCIFCVCAIILQVSAFHKIMVTKQTIDLFYESKRLPRLI